MRIRALSGNWDHFQERLQERGNKTVFGLVAKILLSLDKKAQRRTLPNRDWYFPVMDYTRKELSGYICGQGNWISTYLYAEQAPNGQEIGR